MDDDLQSYSSSPSTGVVGARSFNYGAQAPPRSLTIGQPTIGSGGEGDQIVDEVRGRNGASPIESGAEADPNAEVATEEGGESAAEYLEASPSQLASTEGAEESAASDLRGIEGFDESYGTESAGGPTAMPTLRDAGASVAGENAQEEFLPILAALAPTLISAIGPAVARAVVSKLTPRTRQRLQRQAKTAVKVAGQVVQGVGKLPVSGQAASVIGGATNIIGLLGKLFETAQMQMPSGEAGAEVNEAFVTEAAAALEVIIGTDDRVPITATTQEPWRRICALRITFPSGATYRGSGFFVGPRAVATAGHCVFLHNQGGWARKIEVIPGANGAGRPYGQVESTSLRSVAGWTIGKKPECDYGCVVLPNGSFSGRGIGSFGFANFAPATLLAQPAVVAGYPGDKPFAELWGMARKLKAVASNRLVYDIDTMGGQSGAPVYVKRNGQRYVVGIHNYGEASGNSATRVTSSVYQNLYNWSRL